jgi:hypothetical protein
MDTIGAVAGPLLAIGLMLWFAGDIRAALWFAVLPGVLAVAILVVAVREPERSGPRVAARLPLSRAGLAALGSGYWRVVRVGALFTLARGTEAFLVLRASSLGMTDTWVPLVMVAMSMAGTLVAWPAGRWSDRSDRRRVLAVGLLMLLAADLVLAMANGVPALMLGVVLWGAHLGLSQGVLSAFVADQAPGSLRGSAFGVFNLCSGAALLLAGVTAGWLMDAHGAPAPFWLGAALALAALPFVPGLPLPQSR